MISALEQQRKISKGTILIEPTSGNTGIGLASICAARGYRLILVMPESMSPERRKMLHHLGAQIVLTPGEDGMKGALVRAEELLGEVENSLMPRQFVSPANAYIHETTTAEEIWRDTNGRFDVFITGVGTGGTLTGCGRLFKKRNPAIRIIAVEPENSSVLSGGAPGVHMIQGIGAGFIPSALQTDLIDEIITVPDRSAFETSRVVARIEGIAGGISTGANIAAALTVASRSDMAGKRIVTIAPSSAERYLSTALFSDEPSG